MSGLFARKIKPIPQLAHLSGRQVTVRLPRSLRLRYRRPERLSVSAWADKHRIVTGIDAFAGDWDRSRVPHTVPIMDTIGKPWVRRVCICMPERAAKTQIIVNSIGHFKDQGRRSGNIFLLYPTEEDTKAAIGERLVPVFRAKHPDGRPGRLNRYISPVVDHTTRIRIRFTDNTRLIGAWANSPTSMAKYFGRFNCADEIDKFPVRTQEGTDPISLFEKRAREDRSNSKYIYASTPAGRFIYKMTMECDQIISWGLLCPSCHEYVVPTDDHLVIPDGTTLENVNDAAIELACPACGFGMDEAARREAYHAGREVILKGPHLSRPESVGVHCNAMQLPMIPLTEIAAKKLKAKTGDHEAKVDYSHGYKCVDHKEEVSDRKEDAILRLRDDRPEGLVPSVPIAAITAVADMQKRGFWFVIRAWGYGLEQESWLLKSGYVDSWEALRKIFFESEFRDVHGNRYVVTMRGIDSGGGESEEYADLSRTAEAYLFACANPGIVLFKGRRTMAHPHQVTTLDRLPGTNKPLPGAVKLYTLNSKHFKDRLAAKLLVDPTSPGAWHLHSGYALEQLELLRRDPSAQVAHNLTDFARQMCVEGRDEKGGFWINPKNRPNHLWDAEYMSLALVEIAQVKFMRPPDPARAGGRRVLSSGM